MCNIKKQPTSPNKFQCIVPPYMLDKIVATGDEQLIKMVAGAKLTDNRFRGDRKLFSRFSPMEKNALMDLDIPAELVATTPKPYRKVYDARNTERMSKNKLVRKEGAPEVDDPDVNRVYDAAGHVWNFYFELFGRNSLNRAGLIIKQTVNFGKNYSNAFWTGTQMFYGDGDGELFDNFTLDLDVIAHEMTHGVIQYEADFEYAFQSGALNESYADVFGILVKQRVLNQDVQTSNWLIGESIVIGDEYAIRSMKDPGSAYKNHPVLGDDPQPATMKDYKNLPSYEDAGGVHINSGIPNYAFYVTAREIGGFAWEKAGRIWYEALTNKNLLNTTSQFADAREATIITANKLYGAGSLEEKAVQYGWKMAGVV